MVWIVVVAVLALSLVLLALALLRTYRAAKGLAREVARAGEATASVGELSVGRPAAADEVPSEESLRAREAALAEREAALARREAQITGKAGQIRS